MVVVRGDAALAQLRRRLGRRHRHLRVRRLRDTRRRARLRSRRELGRVRVRRHDRASARSRARGHADPHGQPQRARSGAASGRRGALDRRRDEAARSAATRQWRSEAAQRAIATCRSRSAWASRSRSSRSCSSRSAPARRWASSRSSSPLRPSSSTPRCRRWLPTGHPRSASSPCAGLPLAAYWRGEAAIPLVLALSVVFGLLWFLFAADDVRPVPEPRRHACSGLSTSGCSARSPR